MVDDHAEDAGAVGPGGGSEVVGDRGDTHVPATLPPGQPAMDSKKSFALLFNN